jgi:hypothetical protein
VAQSQLYLKAENSEEAFAAWFMLQSKMVYRNPEEIAAMAWSAALKWKEEKTKQILPPVFVSTELPTDYFGQPWLPNGYQLAQVGGKLYRLIRKPKDMYWVEVDDQTKPVSGNCKPL